MGMRDAFISQALAPFMAWLMLVIAWPFKRAIQKYMKESPLKRALLFKFKRDCNWCNRVDAWIYASAQRLLNACLRATKLKKPLEGQALSAVQSSARHDSGTVLLSEGGIEVLDRLGQQPGSNNGTAKH